MQSSIVACALRQARCACLAVLVLHSDGWMLKAFYGVQLRAPRDLQAGAFRGRRTAASRAPAPPKSAKTCRRCVAAGQRLLGHMGTDRPTSICACPPLVSESTSRNVGTVISAHVCTSCTAAACACAWCAWSRCALSPLLRKHHPPLRVRHGCQQCCSSLTARVPRPGARWHVAPGRLHVHRAYGEALDAGQGGPPRRRASAGAAPETADSSLVGSCRPS